MAGAPTDSENSKRTAWGMAFVLFAVTLSAYIARVNVSVALPYISQDFGWNAEQLGIYGGILLGIFLVGYGVSNILLSSLVDRYGPRRSMFVAVAVFSVLTFLTGLIGLVFSFLVVARLLLGLSQGILFPSASKVTQAWFKPSDRSKVNSLYLSSMHWSNLLVPLILIPIIIITNWRYAFFTVALIGFAVLIPVYFYLRDCPECDRKKREQKPLSEVIEKARKDFRAALKIKGIFILSASDAAGNLVWWGISLWLPTYLYFAKGLSAEQIILVASLPYLGGILGLYLGSWLSDKTGKRVWITFAFQLVGGVFVLLLINATSISAIMICLALIFFFISLLPPNVFTLLQGISPPELVGSATGIMNGIAVGMGVLGPMILGVAVATTSSYDAGLIVMALMQVVSALILLLFLKQEKRARMPKPEPAPEITRSTETR